MTQNNKTLMKYIKYTIRTEPAKDNQANDCNEEVARSVHGDQTKGNQ